MTDSRARVFRAPATTARAAAAAAPAPAVTRAAVLGAHAMTRTAEKGDDKEEKTGLKDLFKSTDSDDKDKDKVEKAASAGTAGDFQSISGDVWGDDSNADKGNSPATNDTGVPKTPSGA